MSRTITQRELRNDSAAIFREVQAGHWIVITGNDVSRTVHVSPTC